MSIRTNNMCFLPTSPGHVCGRPLGHWIHQPMDGTPYDEQRHTFQGSLVSKASASTVAGALDELVNVNVPFFTSVYQINSTRKATSMIVPAQFAGIKKMFHVLIIDHPTGQMTVRGREIPLKLARQVADQALSETEDPTTDS